MITAPAYKNEPLCPVFSLNCLQHSLVNMNLSHIKDNCGRQDPCLTLCDQRMKVCPVCEGLASRQPRLAQGEDKPDACAPGKTWALQPPALLHTPMWPLGWVSGKTLLRLGYGLSVSLMGWSLALSMAALGGAGNL